EAAHAAEVVRAEHRSAMQSAPGRSTPVLAERMLQRAAAGDTIASPETRAAIFETAATGLTAKDVDAAFRRDLGGAGPFLIVTAPEDPQVAAAKKAWQEASTAPVRDEAAPAAAQAQWAYADFGQA